MAVILQLHVSIACEQACVSAGCEGLNLQLSDRMIIVQCLDEEKIEVIEAQLARDSTGGRLRSSGVQISLV